MPESDRLLIGYQQAVADVRARVMNYANAIWGGLPAFRDAQAERLIARLVPMVTAGQLQVANLTSSYIARAVSGGVPLPVDRDGVTRGRGVDPELLYRRPFEQVWADLSESAPLDAAVAAGATRLMHLVATDMQMAKVRQADASLQAAGVKAYRRVLNGPKNCALCVIASTQRYHVGDLSPIHPGCDCSVAP
ncbi:hypothetical protein [Gordonia westfalica]|nr:hypothetical protein [Gordonia westfalica]SDT84991.1 hypothetical protein SAMN04488548_1146 [Gordonia westfalica]SDT85032.1 hypothetical protein SAMN04488548_11419 [Gordonia westfalica]